MVSVQFAHFHGIPNGKRGQNAFPRLHRGRYHYPLPESVARYRQHG
jgi:hypothetical protein